MDYNDLPQNKKLKGVFNFSESQTLIAQRYFIVIRPYAKQLCSSEKNKIEQHMRYTTQRKTMIKVILYYSKETLKYL